MSDGKKNTNQIKDRFLIIKSYDDKNLNGQFITSSVTGLDSNVTELGNYYVIFFQRHFEDNALNLNYSRCDTVKTTKIPKQLLLSLNKNDLIEIVVNKRLLGCYILKDRN